MTDTTDYNDPGADAPHGEILVAEAGQHSTLLRALLAQSRIDPLALAVGDFDRSQMVLDQFPVAGGRRVVVRRNGIGADSIAVTATAVLVIPGNAGRLGGQIVNWGATACQLYLCRAGDVQVGAANRPALWLAANGGSWDFRLGNMLWAGNVSAATASGSTTLSLAEV